MWMGGNGNSQMGIPWEWESVTKMGMGMGRNGKMINGNGWEWERIKQLSLISSRQRMNGSRSLLQDPLCKEQCRMVGGLQQAYLSTLQSLWKVIRTTSYYAIWRVERRVCIVGLLGLVPCSLSLTRVRWLVFDSQCPQPLAYAELSNSTNRLRYILLCYCASITRQFVFSVKEGKLITVRSSQNK